MRYYDTSFRNLLTEILSGYRKMLEQSMIAANDQNYRILVSDKIKKIDESLKIIKPSMFDALTVTKIEKLQTEKFLKDKAAEYEEKEKQLAADYEAKLELAKRELEDQLRTQIEEEIRKERAEKKKRKKAKKDSDAATAIELLLKNMQQNGQTVAVQSSSKSDEQSDSTPDDDDDDDMFPEPELDTVE